MSARPKLVAIVGPTAAGKTAVALAVAEATGGEIISADAVAVYRGFDIGAAKPNAEEQARVRHHLIDVVDPDQEFNAARFAELAEAAIEDIVGRGKRPIVAGGTGLYLKALLHGLFPAPPVDHDLRRRLMAQAEADPEASHRRLAEVDPASAARLEVNDLVRVARALEIYHQTGRPMSELTAEHEFKEARYRALKLGLAVDRAGLHERIAARTEAMLSSGLIDEVVGLIEAGVERSAKPMQAIGYKEIAAYLAGEIDRDEAVRLIVRDTRRLAKRQMTWFKADPDILWLQPDDIDAFVERAKRFWEDDDETG